MEPPKQKKTSSGLKFDGNADSNFQRTPSLVVTLCISASKHMKSAIDRAKWHLPQVGTKLFWSPHQAGSSVILEHITYMSSELEITGLACNANHFIEIILNFLGTKGKATQDALSSGLPPIFFTYRIQRVTKKKAKETKNQES